MDRLTYTTMKGWRDYIEQSSWDAQRGSNISFSARITLIFTSKIVLCFYFLYFIDVQIQTGRTFKLRQKYQINLNYQTCTSPLFSFGILSIFLFRIPFAKRFFRHWQPVGSPAYTGSICNAHTFIGKIHYIQIRPPYFTIKRSCVATPGIS